MTYYPFTKFYKLFNTRKKIENQFLTHAFMEFIIFSKNLERVKKLMQYYLTTALHDGIVDFVSNPVYKIDNEEIPFPFLYFKGSYSCFKELHKFAETKSTIRGNNLKVYYRAYDQYCTNIANSLCSTREIKLKEEDCKNIIFLTDKIQAEVSSFLLTQYTK